MYELWAEEWCQLAKPLTKKQFSGKFTLAEIVIQKNGSFEFIYNDNGLFQGHDVVVRGHLTKPKLQADLFG